MAQPRIAISFAGTGGHRFPALGLAHQLANKLSSDHVLLIGPPCPSHFSLETNPFTYIPIPRHSGHLWSKMQSLFQGWTQCMKHLRHHRIDLVVGFGSFCCLPPLLAAKTLHIPTVVHAADAIPGRALRIWSRWSTLSAYQFPEAPRYLKGPVTFAPLPIRHDLALERIEPSEARKRLRLCPDTPTVTVMGGSQGATFVNELMCEQLTCLLDCCPKIQIIHLTGPHMQQMKTLESTYTKHHIKHHITPFTSDMSTIWSATDFAICRAGASTLAELIHYALPALLIPYPYAKDQHQEKNGAFFAHTLHAGVMQTQHDLQHKGLKHALMQLLGPDSVLLTQRKQHLKKYQTHTQTYCFAQTILDCWKLWQKPTSLG